MLLRAIVIIICLVLASGASAQPTILRPAHAPPARDGWRMVGGVWIRPAGAFRFSQIINATIDAGRLLVKLSPDDEWKPKLINARRIIAEARPDGALWWVMLTQTTQLAPASQRGASIVMLAATEAAAMKEAPLRLVGITLTPGGTILRGAGQADGRFVEVEYRADRSGRFPRLTVVTQAGRGFDFSGDDLLELLRKDPLVVRRFLAPLLKEVSGDDLLKPRAADAYRVFSEIEPTPEEVAQFERIVLDLDADAVDLREAASGKLEQLGPAGVLAAVRADWKDFSPEQMTRLAIFVEKHSLGDTDVARARGDIEFLRGVESFPDRRVRELARELLAGIAD